MALYYIIVILINFFLAVLFYYKIIYTDLSSKTIISIASLSTFIGLIFPILSEIMPYKIVFGFFALIIIGGAYYIVKQENKKNDTKGEENHKFSDKLLGQLMEKELAATTKELARQEIGKEIATNDITHEVSEPVYGDELPERIECEPAKNLNIEQNIEKHQETEDKAKTVVTLNTYISEAFEAKNNDDLDKAIERFSLAMQLNPPLDLAIMISFDISAMLKQLGKYALAVEYLFTFQERWSTQLTDENRKEIAYNIALLSVLDDILIANNTPNLPFAKVPPLVLVSAEKKMQAYVEENL